jgi:hypothetical protein
MTKRIVREQTWAAMLVQPVTLAQVRAKRISLTERVRHGAELRVSCTAFVDGEDVLTGYDVEVKRPDGTWDRIMKRVENPKRAGVLVRGVEELLAMTEQALAALRRRARMAHRQFLEARDSSKH